MRSKLNPRVGDAGVWAGEESGFVECS